MTSQLSLTTDTPVSMFLVPKSKHWILMHSFGPKMTQIWPKSNENEQNWLKFDSNMLKFV